MFTKNLRKFSRKLAFLATLSFLFVACGDDDSGFEPKSNTVQMKEYGSLDEVPACTDSISGDLAKVAGSIYVCLSENWKPVDEVVVGVCNVRACDKRTEGEDVYVSSGKQVYQCRSGSWKTPDGKTFSDDDFVQCYIGALVQDSVAEQAMLDKCNAAKEGVLSVVGKDILACSSTKWVVVSDFVISEADLPQCDDNGFAYVLSKVSAYQCKDGSWYKDGKAVTIKSSSSVSSSDSRSSSSRPRSSSSSGKSSSSGALSSSSEDQSSSSVVVDDGTRVRGVCIASEKETLKGEAVSYSFYNMGGTPQTFTWDFGEGATPEKTDDVAPTVVYSRGGMHRASLIVNSGLVSQSDTIVCSGVFVPGTPVTGCKCTTDVTSLYVGPTNSTSGVWKVSGCTGDAPFTYAWGSSAPGSDSTGVGEPTATGTFAPTVTVYNSDGQTMEPACPAVPVSGPVSVTCRLERNQFTVIYESGASESQSSVPLTLVSEDGFLREDSLLPQSSYRDYKYDYNTGSYTEVMRYIWYRSEYGSAIRAALPDPAGALVRYSVLQGGDTICSDFLGTCQPNQSSIVQGASVAWSLRMGSEDVEADSYEWTFTDADGRTQVSTEASPSYIYSTSGRINATLTVNKGTKSEKTLTCSPLKVQRPVTGCACGAPTLETDTKNIATESLSYVSYSWHVTGCEGAGDGDLSYEWAFEDTAGVSSRAYKMDNTVSFRNPGVYEPTVTVTNVDGAKKQVTCGKAHVFDVSCNISKDYMVTKGDSLTWSIESNGDYSPTTYSWSVGFTGEKITGSKSTIKAAFTKIGYIDADVLLDEGLETELALTCPAPYINTNPVTGCTCEGPVLLSSSHYIQEGDMTYQWKVTGCESAYSLPLTYEWPQNFTPDSEDASIATMTFKGAGIEEPRFGVKNVDGMNVGIACNAAYAPSVTCAPSKNAVTVGETVHWIAHWTYLNYSSFEWTIKDGDSGPETVSSALTPEIEPTLPGVMRASITFNKGTDSAFTVPCSTLTVNEPVPEPPAITGCVCDGDVVPKTSPEEESRLQWTVTGCTSEGAMPLTYTWSDEVTPDPDDATVASLVPTEPGSYSPTVTVENTAGGTLDVTCKKWNYSN